MLNFLLALVASLPAHAFRLDPMVVSLPLKAPLASGTYVVENTTKEKVAVQFEVRKRLVGVDGKEERPEALGFLVYPEQMALEPGEKRNVRVTWQGESMPAEELAFRFVATQLPVDFQKDKDASRQVKFKFLMEYVASLYLVPAGVKPKMRLLKKEVRNGKLELLVANEGSAHFLLDGAKLSLKAKGKSIPVSDEAMSGIRTENVLPGSQRLLSVPLPKGTEGEIEVSLVFGP